MTDNKPSVQQKERRQRIRQEIPKPQDTKVLVFAQQDVEKEQKEAPEECWQGCLGNICELGAQIIVEEDCWGQLSSNQKVKLQIDIPLSETKIKAEIIGNVIYVVPDEQDNKIKMGVRFSESELDADTKRAIPQACEAIGPCLASEFGDCPKQ